MKTVLIFVFVFILPFGFIVWITNQAVDKEMADKAACEERGGFPVSKGPRTYAYHCFKANPLLGAQP